ncbi:MAG TPA: hypothetical protein VF202_07180, partial [Trueperaceae bacterium]
MLALLALSGCARGPNPDAGPAELSLSLYSGPPGTPIAVRGIELDIEDATEVQAWLGDEPAVLLVAEDGTISTAVPLFLGSAGWPEPPSGPQTFELRRGEQVIGRSTRGV